VALRPGLAPGACKGKAHTRDHLGYGGRRVLAPILLRNQQHGQRCHQQQKKS